MLGLLHWLAHAFLRFAQTLGAPGIALISALDASFLTFPEVPDALVVVLTIAHPESWFYHGAMATVGSVLGSLTMFILAQKSGDALLSRWVKAGTRDRLFGLFKSYGMLTLVAGSLMPPPMPLKPFVLLAGITGLSTSRFLVVVSVSRGVRYLGLAWMAKAYGQQFIEYLDEHMRRVSIGLVILFGAAAVTLVLRKIRHRRSDATPAA